MDNTNAGNESTSGESDSNDLPKSPVESSRSADMFSAILGFVGDIATDYLNVSPAAETLSQSDIDEITDDIKDFVGSAEVQSALDQDFRREQIAKGSEQTVGFDDAHVDFDAVYPIKRVLNEEAFYSVKHFYLTTYDCFSYVGLSLEVPTKEIQHLAAAQILTLSG